MRHIFLFFLITCSLSQTFPPLLTWVDTNGVVRTSFSLTGNTLTLYFQKSRPGFLAYGFGANMTNADIFLIESAGTLTIKSCRLTGSAVPQCSGSIWTLAESTLNSDGTWKAIVTRDISIANGVTIHRMFNSIIYDLSDNPTLEIGNSLSSNVHGMAGLNFTGIRATGFSGCNCSLLFALLLFGISQVN